MHTRQAGGSALLERVVRHHQLHTVSREPGVPIPRSAIPLPRYGVVSPGYGFASPYSLAHLALPVKQRWEARKLIDEIDYGTVPDETVLMLQDEMAKLVVSARVSIA